MNRAWFVTMAIRVAALAVASLFVSSAQPVPARAASVGGECCADLEERVAELEAMAVAKGNRGISLQISGHVNKMIMYWNDGINDDVYIVDNKELETRFRLKGNANIAPEWSVGFMIEIGVVSADSSAVDVRTDGVPNENTDGILRNRLANFYIQSDQLGRITVGRGSPATDNIVLLNIAKTLIADSDIDWANDFHLVRPRGTAGCNGAGCRSTLNMDNISPSQDTRRANVVRYDTPSLFGLVFSTAWGEDDIADIAIRYKKEWNSIRFVGGVGYLWATDEREGAATGAIACPSGLGQAACADERFDLERILGSVSAMYVPSGIFVYAAAAHDDFGVSNNQSHLNRSSFVAPITGQQPEDATMWYVQLGFKRRLLAPNLGATTIYSECQAWNDFGVRRTAATLGFGANSEITDTSANMWGVGLVQEIDPVAMKLFTGLRYWDHNIRAVLPSQESAGQDIPLEHLFAITAGGRINF